MWLHFYFISYDQTKMDFVDCKEFIFSYLFLEWIWAA